ncbi:MAG: IPT/TIG domain-containing protein [Prevotellaceae bacterium]|jgi:hypothetical protein|nr:IPT/TIG domain-containing protein [Prevotellaceae bacterium]
MKNIYCLILFMFFCTGAFISCTEESKNEVIYDPSQPVRLISFYPDSGRISEKIILLGQNFGRDPELVSVYFNNKQAKVVGVDGDMMYVVCPRMPGDTCTVSVKIGNDSAVYTQKFRYRVSVSVSTVTGNGKNEYLNGDLSSAQIRARYLAVDLEGNVYAIQRSDGTDGLIRVNEMKNSVDLLGSNLSAPNALCIDMQTGVITFPGDSPQQLFFRYDPVEGIVRTKNLVLVTAPDGTGAPGTTTGSSGDGRYKHAMAACPWDGYVYTRFRGGDIVRIDPVTFESYTIYTTAFGDSYGLAFDPKNPSVLYIAMLGEVRDGYGNSICSIDVSDPTHSFKMLSAPATSGGFRDGKLENAQFRNPCQIYFDPDGFLYIADRDNHCIRRVTPDKVVETVVGIPGTSGYKDGSKDEALFKAPWGLGVSQDGTVYVADYDNARIRKLAIE